MNNYGKRNPNGYGCVTKLKGNRSRPWVVKVTVYDDQGGSKQVPVGYAESEEKPTSFLQNITTILGILTGKSYPCGIISALVTNQAAKTGKIKSAIIAFSVQTLFKNIMV